MDVLGTKQVVWRHETRVGLRFRGFLICIQKASY